MPILPRSPADIDPADDYAAHLLPHRDKTGLGLDPVALSERVKELSLARMGRAAAARLTAFETFHFEWKGDCMELAGTWVDSKDRTKLNLAVARAPFSTTSLLPGIALRLRLAAFGREGYCQRAALRLCRQLARLEAEMLHELRMPPAPGAMAHREKLSLEVMSSPSMPGRAQAPRL